MERIAAPTNARSRRTRSALLDAARGVIEDQGVRAVTMAGVAARAGVTRRAAYLHFATRADLLVALFDHVATDDDLAGALEPVWAAASPDAALDAWVEGLARYLDKIAGVAAPLARERHADPDVGAHWQVVAHEHRRGCERLARQIADAGRLAPGWTVATATDLLWLLMGYDIMGSLVDEAGWSVDGYVERLRLLLRSTLLSG